MSFRIGGEKLLGKCKTIQIKIEDLKNFELNAGLVCGDKYIKAKKIIYNDKFCINFCALNVPKANTECQFFTIFSVDSFFGYKTLQVYLGNCTFKIVNKQMIDYLGDNPFETDED